MYEYNVISLICKLKPLLGRGSFCLKDLEISIEEYEKIRKGKGLAPQEIDNLHNSEFGKIETPLVARKVFWIFQTKIIALPPEDRWKPIPVGIFKRLLLKTIRHYFSRDIDLYGRRKGFTDRTWQSYKHKKKFHLK